MSVYPNNYVVSLVNAQWTHLLQLDQEKELGAFFVFFIHKASKSSWPTTKFSTKIKLKTMHVYMQIAKFCKIFILLCKVFKGAQSWPGWPDLNVWKREMPNMRNCQSPILISELESISDCDRCSASEIQFTLFEMVNLALYLHHLKSSLGTIKEREKRDKMHWAEAHWALSLSLLSKWWC